MLALLKRGWPVVASFLSIGFASNSGKRLRPISWAVLSVAAGLSLFPYAIPLDAFSTYLTSCIVVGVSAIAVAFVDRYLWNRIVRPRAGKHS